MEQFQQWLHEGGLPEATNLVEVAEFDITGRGCAAKHAISKGDTIVEIPKRFIMCRDSAMDTELGVILNENSDYFDNMYGPVILQLLYERCSPKNTFWKPYIAVLPQQFDSLIHWSEEDLELLNGCQIYEAVTQNVMELHSSFTVLHSVLSRYPQQFPAIPTFDDFLWAVSCLLSRGYWLVDEVDPCIVPLADMLNHNDDGGKYTWADYCYDTESRSFKLIANIGYEQGKQVWTTYGNKSNWEWLFDYGMIVSSNKHDVVRVVLPSTIIANAADLEEKKAILPSYPTPFNLLEIAVFETPHSALRVLRVLLCPRIADKSLYSQINFHVALSPTLEVRCYQTLVACCQAELDRLPGSDKDETVLRNGAVGFSNRQTMALYYRQTLRENLRVLIESLSKRAHYIQSNGLSSFKSSAWDQYAQAIDLIAANESIRQKLHWQCSQCTFFNTSYPSVCEACDTPNPNYASASLLNLLTDNHHITDKK